MCSYRREDDLKDQFNNTVQKALGIPRKDYYSSLSVNQLLKLKTALHEINNIMTMKLTLLLINWLTKIFQFPEEDKNRIVQCALSTKPNANGYDLVINNPEHILAEVKCNIPVKSGNQFGAAQKNGLVKDVDGLLKGKSKARLQDQLHSYYKILALYDTPEARTAATQLFSKRKDVLIGDEIKSKDKVHVVFLN